jgi:hypothetical protein
MLISNRCHRLNKQCLPLKPGRKRAERPPTKARIEDKLDELVTLLQSQAPAKLGIDHAQLAKTLQVSKNVTPLGVSNASISGSTSGSTPPISVTGSAGATLSLGPTSMVEAEEYLLFFRTQMLPFSPMMYIPSTTIVGHFQQEYPILWSCIVALTVKPVSQQVSLGNQVRETIVEKVAHECERSLDLLLAILCFLGWLANPTTFNYDNIILILF